MSERLDFAQAHKDWTSDDWSRVIFADEAYLCIGSHGQIWVQRPVCTEFLLPYMVTGHAQFAPKFGVFGCFASGIAGPLQILDGTMNTQRYQAIVQSTVLPFAVRLWPGPNREWRYQHDNARYHGNSPTLTWLESLGIKAIKMPPYSPDLNHIENLFNYWKRKVELRNASTIEELKVIAVEEWNKIPSSVCTALGDSMPDRIQAVVDAEGHKTGY